MVKPLKIKKIIFVLVISAIVGLVHVYPDLKFIRSAGNNFKGITFNATQDAAVYLGRINTIYNGGRKHIPSIDIYEHRNDPWTLPFLGELILGTIGSSLHIPLNYFKIIFSFLLPVIIFWLIYFLAFLLCSSRPAAVVCALATTLGYSFFTNNPKYAYDLLFNRQAAIQLWFLRPISPQFTYILLMAAWITAYFLVTRKSYIYALLGGFLIGLFWYAAGIYYVSYFCAFLGVYFLYTLLKKDYPQLKKIVLAALIIIVVSAPFAVNYLKLIRLPEYGYFLQRLSFMYGRIPIIPAGITLCSIFIVWFHYSRRTKAAEFIILFVLSGFICLNQQLITGRTSQPSHWQNYMVKTFTLIALFSTAALYLREKKFPETVKKTLKISAMVIFVTLALLQQENYYQRFRGKFVEMQSLSGPFNWLNENSSREDVVLNDPMNFVTGNIPYQQDLLMYANNYVYLPSVLDTLASREETEHRYLSALRFFGYDLNDAHTFFTYWNGIAFRGMSAEVSYGGSIMPDAYLQHLKNKYAGFLKEDALGLLSKYRVNYVLIGRTSGFYDLIDSAYKGTRKVYDDGRFKIYKINAG
ncbi:MAG: hypothetical protein Q8O22_06735 [Candidatus Omnitrophota bacterium]|nr:hypothetical protein [Candidatus Omnitrophota bacterium]